MKRSMVRVLVAVACLSALPGCGGGEDLRTVVFRGSGSDGGNAHVVSLGFALRSPASGVRLEWLDLLADSVTLPLAPECRDDRSVQLDPPAAPLTVRLTSSRLTRFELQVPAAEQGCWLRIDTPPAGALLRLRGRLPDGTPLFIETDLAGGPALLPRTGRLAWGTGEINDWLLVLDLGAALDPNLFTGVQPGTDGVVRIDTSTAPGVKDELDRRVRAGLFLIGDLNADQRLSDGEWADGNVLATGVSGAAIDGTPADGDADQADREEPPCPAVIFTPAELRFEPVEPGSSTSRELAIRNFGCSDLLMSDLEIAGAGPADFSVESPDALPVVVPPGSQLDIGVRLAPVEQACVRGTLELVSNDPVSPIVNVNLVVEGCAYQDGDQTDGDAPVAPAAALDYSCQNCEYPTSPQPLDKVVLDAGSSQVAPGGGLLSYWWELEDKPPFSQDAVLICSSCDYQNPVDTTRQWTDQPTAKLFLPVAGRYVIRVKVRDSRGVESTDNPDPDLQWGRVTLDVTPRQAVYIQLVWDAGYDADLDLHLTRYREQGTFGVSSSYYDHPSGMLEACTTDSDCSDEGIGLHCNPTRPAVQTAPEKICTLHTGAQQNDDCFFRNRRPDWGTEGEAGDDASLDIDDVDGYGPEIVSIRRPSDGTFRMTARRYTGPVCAECPANVCDCRTAGTCTATDLEKCEWCEGCRQVEDLPVTASITIYLKGRKAGEFSQQLTRNNLYWKVADIVWNGGEEGSGAVTAVPVGQACDTPPCPPEANPFFSTLSVMDPADPDNSTSIWCDAVGDPDCP